MNKRPAKIIVVALTLSLLFFSSLTIAGTIGNPTASVKQSAVTLTAELDLMDKDMDWNYGGNADLESTRLLAKCSYGITDLVNVFGRLGLAKLEVNRFKSDFDIAYGLGLNGTVYTQDKISVGVLGQFMMLSSDDDGVDLDVSEIDLACGVNYLINQKFSSYGGLVFSKVNADFDGPLEGDQDSPVSIFFGGEFNVNPKADIGLELRLFGENSFTALANFNF